MLFRTICKNRCTPWLFGGGERRAGAGRLRGMETVRWLVGQPEVNGRTRKRRYAQTGIETARRIAQGMYIDIRRIRMVRAAVSNVFLLSVPRMGLSWQWPVSCGMCASRNRLGGRYNRFARSCQAIGADGGRAAGRTRLCGNARRVARGQAVAIERWRWLDGRGGWAVVGGLRWRTVAMVEGAVAEGGRLPDGCGGRGAAVVEGLRWSNCLRVRDFQKVLVILPTSACSRGAS